MRKTQEYKVLLQKLKKGENLQICEVDALAKENMEKTVMKMIFVF